MNDTTKFVKSLTEYVPNEIVRVSDSGEKVYLFAPKAGFGVPASVYEGLTVCLTESIGMDALTESHRLYNEDAHHVLIFKVM